jgi:hypothetical protein
MRANQGCIRMWTVEDDKNNFRTGFTTYCIVHVVRCKAASFLTNCYPVPSLRYKGNDKPLPKQKKQWSGEPLPRMTVRRWTAPRNQETTSLLIQDIKAKPTFVGKQISQWTRHSKGCSQESKHRQPQHQMCVPLGCWMQITGSTSLSIRDNA